MTLHQRIRARAAFDDMPITKCMYSSEQIKELMALLHWIDMRQIRLQPLFEQLIACVEALEDIEDESCAPIYRAKQTLALLRENVGGK